MAPTEPWAQDALSKIEKAWAQAAQTWNVDALSNLYTDDALFYGALPGHSVGRAKVREYFAAYSGAVTSAKFKLSEQQIKILSPVAILAQGLAHFDIALSDGTRKIQLMRSTWLLVRSEKSWRLQQHHFSPPPLAPPVPLKT